MIKLFCAITLIFIVTQVFLYTISPIIAAVNVISLIFMFYLSDDTRKKLEELESEEDDD